MDDSKLGVVEMHFAEIIWENEPVNSGNLVKLSQNELNWKKSTTYTVLKKLCDRGLFKNEGSIVTSVISKQEYLSRQSENFINETFEGSLPAFIASFTKQKVLTEQETKEILKMIAESGEKSE